MAEDEEVKREVWAGHVPIRLVLASNEVPSLDTPLPFYVMAPRNSYLPLVLEQARSHFQSYIASSGFESADLWLEYQDIPLKWHLPTGMLYDMLAKAIDLPWNLTVHFQAFPDKVVLRLLQEEAMRSRFFHTMKEAICARNGSTKKINNLSVAETTQLWEAVKTHDFDMYWRVANKILDSEGVKTITTPVRIHVSGHPNPTQHSIATGDNTTTLGGALHTVLPELFPEPNPTSSSTLAEVIVQGVRPPLWTPLRWLSDNLSSIDSFLYIYIQTTQ